MTVRVSWPGGKQFAFSVFDDTDLTVPGNFEAVYDLLGSLGMRTTKSVWPATGADLQSRSVQGSTCENCLQLQGSAGANYRPCGLFPGKLVSVGGWCSSWTPEM